MMKLSTLCRAGFFTKWLAPVFIITGLSKAHFLAAQDYSFDHYKVEDGLSQYSVLTIGQDQKGFMWFGTRYGLNRFDGRNFITYTNKPTDSCSISENYIYEILKDSRQKLWIATENGLNLYVPESNAFKRYLYFGSEVSKKNIIYSLSEDTQGRIWVACTKGLYIYNTGKDVFDPISTLGLDIEERLGRIPARVYCARNGDIWLGGAIGLFLIQQYNGRYNLTSFPDNPAAPNSLSNKFVKYIKEDPAGNLWIGTLDGLNRYERKTGSFIKYYNNPANANSLVNNNIRCFLWDGNGNMWIGTQEGLSCFNSDKDTWKSFRNKTGDPKSLSQNSVHSLFLDKNNSIWIGTFFAGINVTHKQLTEFKYWQNNQSANSLSNNTVSGIVTDKQNNIWITTEGGGLNFYDRARDQFTIFKNNPADLHSIGSNLLKTLYIDSKDNLWIGTHGRGLNLYNPASRSFSYYLFSDSIVKNRQDEIAAIMEDTEGLLWIAKHPGVDVLQKQGNILSKSRYSQVFDSLSTKLFTSLLEDANRNVWIGSFYGLYFFERKSGTLSKLTIVDGPKTENINCLKEDSKGNIWIGLYYGGLACFEKNTQKFTIYKLKDGLPNDNILSIQEDRSGMLWISTGNGLCKFDKTTGSFFTYTTSDGLPGNEFNYNASYQSPQGELFFGNMNGLVSFFPERIMKNSASSPLVFTGLKLFNSTVEINDESGILKNEISFLNRLSFSHNQNSFTFQFALLNYIKSDKNKYAYKLKGINDEWIETRDPSATFTNLATGSYTLLVKGANSDGVWSEPIEMQFVIRPPFWKTWWAYAIYIIAVASIIFLILRFFFLRAILKKENELHQVKLNFFTNISHEIRTHLSLILAPIDTIERENKDNFLLQQRLNSVKNNANSLLNLVTELMDFRKAETGNLKLHFTSNDFIQFINTIYASFEELAESKHIHLSIVHEPKELFIHFDKDQLEKVFYNLLINAFKFTPDNGRIAIYIKTDKTTVTTQVKDNGKGIAPEYLDTIFNNYFQIDDFHTQNKGYGIGLALTKKIVELHQGNMYVNSTKAKDTGEQETCFEVVLPLKPDQKIANSTTQQFPEPEDNDGRTNGTAERDSYIHKPADNTYTVLLAEDNIELNGYITDILKAEYKVISCITGTEAWNKAIEQIPDIIISDIMMPDMDGLTLCNQLKQDTRTNHIPVILLTAKSTQTDQISGLTQGADLYLTKPFSSQVLELSIRNIISSRETFRKKYALQLQQYQFQNPGNNIEVEFIEKLIQIIDENMDNPEFGVEMLATKSAMSQSVLYKKVKALTDMSVNEFTKSIKLKKAAVLLKEHKYSVNEVSYMVGFNDRKYFSKEFKKQFGKNPSEFWEEENT